MYGCFWYLQIPILGCNFFYSFFKKKIMKKLLPLLTLIIGLLLGYSVFKYFNKCKSPIRFVRSTGKQIPALGFATGTAALLADEAEKYLTRFKNSHVGSDIAFSIDSLDIATLLRDIRCKGGIRVYLGVKDEAKPNEITLMFTGIDDNRENVFIKFMGDDYVIDYTNPCPKDCPPPSSDRRTIKP